MKLSVSLSMLHLAKTSRSKSAPKLKALLHVLLAFTPVLYCNAAKASPLSYADIADLVTPAPIVVKIIPKSVKLLRNGAGGAPPSGFVRAHVVAKLAGVIRSEGALPPLITYLIDLPLGPNGRNPSGTKSPQIIFARPAGRPDFVQLVSRYGQLPWSIALEEQVRPVVAEAIAIDSPPIANGVGEAFYNQGTIEGESETQIFLKTISGIPISLSILRHPGSPAKWGVSTGEVVDENDVQPSPGTLLWYSLACGLPASLPEESSRTLSATDAEAVRTDYQFVMQSLGSCGRTL